MGIRNTVKIYVEKAENGTYWGTTKNVYGVVSANADSLEALKHNMQRALTDYLEVSKDEGEEWVKDLQLVPDFEYKLGIPSFFKLLPELKISLLAGKAGINESLMKQYATGKANASEKIEKAIHELGEELLSVSL